MEKKFGVAAKAIIKNEEDKFLILFKSKIEDINPNEIDIPGGRIEFGENTKACLEREVKEETNLIIKIIKPSHVWNIVKGDLHLVGITFTASLTSGEVSLSSEHDAYRWMTKKEILDGDYPDWIREEFREL